MNDLRLIALILLVSCIQQKNGESTFVKTADELKLAIKEATPGDEIILANGIWQDVTIEFYGQGTLDQPITLKAETPGEAFIEGRSYLHLGGQYLIVDGLYFRNGHTPTSSIIRYKIGDDSTAFHSRITNCVIQGFTQPSRLSNDHWIEFYGQHNTLDHCYISGKSNDGETLRVFQTGNEHTKNHHQIIYNYFGPRPRKGGPRAETIRIGDSKTHMTPGYVNVSDNYFEACNGEVEIISDKTNFNTFRSNVFYKCEGSLVLRHGSYATVDGNIFIGGDECDFYGGLRVINTGHWITNNYFYKINGSAFRSPLAMMNGIPKSQLNRYRQVTDVVVAHNTWVDCRSPWQVGVGQNMKSIDVLPEVEIRSAPPIRSIIANNLIYNGQADSAPVVNHHNIEGILFKNNVLDNAQQPFTKFDALQHQALHMKPVNDWLLVPEDGQSGPITDTYKGFDFDKIEQDLFGSSRGEQNYVGAISQQSAAQNFQIDKSQYGPAWFVKEPVPLKARVIPVSSQPGELAEQVALAQPGDIIELTDPVYTIAGSLSIDKVLTIRSVTPKTQLVFNGPDSMPAFEMHPKGDLNLQGISLKSTGDQWAFSTRRENMSSAYNLSVVECKLEDFGGLLKAHKGSFADSITFEKTQVRNCQRGLVLAAEEKGDYNAEVVTINECKFTLIRSDVIHFYRGGYDESTIGGCLTVSSSIFENCGMKEKTGILLKTRGIINVNLSGNTFRNNPIERIALLWGEKNNHHQNNTTINSGSIQVEEQLKLDILY